MPHATEERIVVILQSNYIPWKGYFDLMNAADVFVLFDEVQFTRRDWRNRNKIIIGGQPKWLTIPVETKGEYHAAIHDIRVSDPRWAEKHWKSIRLAYGKTPFFRQYESALEAAYEAAASFTRLSDINMRLLECLQSLLGISTVLDRSETVPRVSNDPTGRLVELCAHFGATRYVSGPAAKSYIDPDLFEQAGIALSYADYSGYPMYAQDADLFEHGVSVIDLLMRVGPEASNHFKSHRVGGLWA